MAEKYIALPKGVSENTFDAAIAAWSGIRRRISWQCSSVVIFYERHRNFPCFSHCYPQTQGAMTLRLLNANDSIRHSRARRDWLSFATKSA